MKCILLCLLGLTSICCYGQSAVEPNQAGHTSVKEYEQVFTTYPFSDPSPVPLMNNVYPYFRYDGFAIKPVQKKWKVIELENDYIRLLILPEIGGKVWAAIEKSTNQPFLYFNHVVKFRDVAMRGPWTSGGLESNYGKFGHTPNCATPVDYLTRANADGSVSCFIGALDLLTRSYWRVEINLPRDKAYFTTRSFWYNATALQQPYYHWMNAGLKASDDLEFVYPGNRYLGHNGEYDSWPVNASNGKIISWYRNNDFGGPKSYHVFGKYTDFFGAFWHHDSLGMVRYGTHDDKAGKKIWIWGLSRQGMIWEHLLTDTDGQYVEVQSGRLFNQNTEKSSLTPFKHRSLEPYQSDNWKEYWYPVLKTRGFVAATDYGALNIQADGKLLRVYFSPTQGLNDTLLINRKGQAFYKRLIHAVPLQLFADSIPYSGGREELTAMLGPHLLSWSGAPSAGDLSRPVDAPAGFNWGSPYGQDLLAREEMDQKNFPAAQRAVDSALQQDPWFFPSLVTKAELCYRSMRYADALSFAKKALSINTEDGSANFIYGLVNFQLGNTTDSKDGFDIASLSPAYRSAAFTSLARVYLRENDLIRALSYTEKALGAQPQNVDALQLRAVAARLQGDSSLYRNTLNALVALDPLNHFALFEEIGSGFTRLVNNELPQESFLELGIWYVNCNQTANAIRVLQLSPPVAEVRVWLAWLTHQPLDTATLDPVRAFPFRSETAEILERMLPTNDSWFLRYQLALIYNDRGRGVDARHLISGLAPDFAPFYAFRAALAQADTTEAKANPLAIRLDLEHARSLDPQWRYQKLLAEFELAQGNPDKAETVAGTFYKAHTDNYIMGMLYARALLASGKYAECVALLRSITIIPFEGATTSREMYREALLMQAVGSIKRHDYRKALSFISEAKKWPENLGVGEPYIQDQDLFVEDKLAFLSYSGLGQTEQATALKPHIDGHREQPGNASDLRILGALGQ